MRLRISLGGLILSLAFGIQSARAANTTSAFSSVPDRFRTQELTLGSRGLGEICYSWDIMPDGTVCNPAYLSEVRDSLLLIRLFVGNGYAALNSADKFVNKPLTRETMQEVFTRENTLAVEGHVGLSFTTNNFSAAFSPYRVQYASEVHNPNFPVVSLHAAVERSFVLAGGMNFRELFEGDERISFGTRLRILERRFVHGQFSLFQALTEEPRDYLPSRKQKAVLLDPSFAFVTAPAAGQVRGRFSLGAQNLGWSSPEYAEYPNDPDLYAGAGVELPMKYGRVRAGLDLVDIFYAETFTDRLRFGTSYKIGLIEAMIGINSNALTAGVEYGLSFLQAGIVYEFVRDDLNNGGMETRLATEVAFRL